MNDYLMKHPALVVAFIAIVVIVACLLFVKAMQTIGMERVRAYVYKLFIEAEHEFRYGDNTEKFEYVINLAKSAIPTPFNLFITEALLRKVVQAWFDISKDLLDDGKINGSKEE